MDRENKKTLLQIAYYGTSILTIALSIVFMIAMGMHEVAVYQKIVYYIWSIILILTIILDIVASIKHDFKFLTGLVIAALAFLCLVMGIIVYASFSVEWMVPFFAMGRFFTLVGFSTVLTILGIVVFCTGEKLINHNENK
ncbi:MAG: hypothetical protein IKB42_05050 [Clostridia bacterium]|nr:hypothetical protein [Clostridia bacterium]